MAVQGLCGQYYEWCANKERERERERESLCITQVLKEFRLDQSPIRKKLIKSEFEYIELYREFLFLLLLAVGLLN